MSNSSEKKEVKADTVVLSVGLRPNRDLYDALLGRVPNLHLIGDARKAHNIMNSIWDAHEVARGI
jgi:2-enoate reductase